MTPNLVCLDVYMQFAKPQKVNGSYDNKLVSGKVILSVAQGRINLTNVMFFPSLVAILLAEEKCMWKKCTVLFCAETQTVKLYNTSGGLFEAFPINDLLVLRTQQTSVKGKLRI